jgi:tRNA A-37 threonylcarbamoyl transferase component Bud32
LPLDPRSVVDFLLERGAIAPEDVLDRSLSVRPLRRRNACFAVRRDGAGGLFVKQARTGDPLNRVSLDVEWRVARAAAEGARLAPVAAVSPALRLYDEHRRILVFELLEEAEELNTVARREGGLAPDLARALGSCVGVLHRDAPLDAGDSGAEPNVTWILKLGGLDDWQLPRGRGIADLRDAVREDAAFAAGLAELRATWRTDAFLHGDLKWENVMVRGRGADARVHLVDWEMAAIGDAAWDLGGLLHAYVRHWVLNLPREAYGGADGPAGAPRPSRADEAALKAMAPSAAALWDGYRSAARPQAPAETLLRAVRFAGARLLQTAIEDASGGRGLHTRAVAFAQLAANVVAAPREAAAALLGLSPDAA